MGYLNNASVTVDAILTTKGREILSQGGNMADGTVGLNIKYFALGDDEVDYDLWNPANPLGSDYYGIIIENMPVLEASPIPEQNLKSKLITLSQGSTTIAQVIANPASLGSSTIPAFTYFSGGVLTASGNEGKSLSFSLSIANQGNNNQLGYTVYYDSKYFRTNKTNISQTAVEGKTLQAINVSAGETITIFPQTNAPAEFSSVPAGGISIQNIYVQGNEIGGRATVPVYIYKLGI